MKNIIVNTLLFTIATTSCNAEEVKPHTSIAKAQEKTNQIIALSKSSDFKNLQKQIRPQEESKIQRQAATKENVARIFKDIDAKKVKLGKSFYYPERKIVIVRIEEPIKIDLEYYFDETSGEPPILQALHP